MIRVNTKIFNPNTIGIKVFLKDVRKIQRDFRVSLIGASEFGTSDNRKIEGHLSNVAKAMSNLDHALSKMKLDLGI